MSLVFHTTDGFHLCSVPPNVLLHVSVFVLDVVAGIPKRFMLYGLVRRLNHHFHLFKWRLILQLGLIQQSKNH